MTIQEISEWLSRETQQGDFVRMSDEMMAAMTVEQAREVIKQFGANTLLLLPSAEIRFFEWLKERAPEVWNDLWQEDEVGNQAYVVALAHLEDLLPQGRGFPICDLQNQPNFYFTYKHILHEEAKPYVDAVLQKLEDGKQLSLAETFVLEIREKPLDIWRFAYNYKLDPEQAKAIVYELVEGGILQYTPSKDELSEYHVFGE